VVNVQAPERAAAELRTRRGDEEDL
jgi:hypothetical protein